MKSMTVRLSEEEYKRVKIMLINKNMTFQDYIISLIVKDSENHSEHK